LRLLRSRLLRSRLLRSRLLRSISDSIDLNTFSIYSGAVGVVANGLVGGRTMTIGLIIGSRASYLGRTLLAFILLGLDNLVDPAFLVVELLFTGDLAMLSSLEINSSLLAPLLLIKLLTLVKLTTLVEELLFIGSLAKLTLVLLILKVRLIPIEGLVKLIALIAVEPIFVDSPAPLVLLDYLAKSPSMEFSSLKLFQAIAPKESTGFFLGIQVLAPLIPPNNSIALTLSVS